MDIRELGKDEIQMLGLKVHDAVGFFLTWGDEPFAVMNDGKISIIDRDITVNEICEDLFNHGCEED